MPVQLTIPEIKPAITTAKIISFGVDVQANLLWLVVGKGYMDGANFIVVEASNYKISGAEFSELANSNPVANKTMYENIANKLYVKCFSNGWLEGAVV